MVFFPMKKNDENMIINGNSDTKILLPLPLPLLLLRPIVPIPPLMMDGPDEGKALPIDREIIGEKVTNNSPGNSERNE